MKKMFVSYLIILFTFFFSHLTNVSASYYNVENAPEFYGLTKAIIQKGDEFSLKDAKFRIFARDFEDEDLTRNISIISNNVDTTKEGVYYIHYEVIDSHNNKTNLKVEIDVINDASQGRYYERTLYSLPSVQNMALVGTNRGNNDDRQILGFYMEKNSKISVKKISGDKNLTLTYLNNDSHTEKNFDIKNDYVDITHSYSGVPFIKTIYESNEPIVIGIKENDIGVHSLPFYHYGDDEQEFFSKWNSLVDSYAVVDSEDLNVLVPYYDRDKLVNYYKNCFHSLDEFFLFWHNVMNQYDEYLGLSYNPEDPIDQNVKTKYFVKANIHGAGAAYYAWDHVGINSNSVASFFEVNWGGLHEVGHGYQGSLANDLQQGEVSNNILGYYVQMNKSFYPYPLNWLGEINKIEDKYQLIRQEGKSYYDLDVAGRLYFVINLLDYKDSKETYATINKIWRRSLLNNKSISSIDAYALAFYNLYHINVAPYFDTWDLSISSEINEIISDGSIPSILYDILNDKADEIRIDLEKDGKYSLVSNEEIKKYELKGNLQINIKIDNIDDIKNKKIIVKNEDFYHEFIINNNYISIKDIPIGTYEVILPVPKNNIYEYQKFNYVSISYNNITSLDLDYKSINLDLINDYKIELKGLGDSIFADITFDNQIMNITTYKVAPHVYFTDFYAKIEIYDLNNQIVYSKEFIGNTNYDKSLDEIPYIEGYKIVIFHREGNGRLVVKSNLLDDNVLSAVRDESNTYIIGKYSLYQNNQDDYNNYLEKIDAYVLKLKNDLTENEIINKNLNTLEKSKLLISILNLKDKEKNEYLEKYKYIYNGSYPKLLNTKLGLKQNELSNIYSLLKISDLEDGTYYIDKENLKLDYNLIINLLPGIYNISYEIKDSDDNITSGIIDLTVLKVDNEIEEELPKEDIIGNEEDIPKEDIIDNEEDNLNNVKEQIIAKKNITFFGSTVIALVITFMLIFNKMIKN